MIMFFREIIDKRVGSFRVLGEGFRIDFENGVGEMECCGMFLVNIDYRLLKSVFFLGIEGRGSRFGFVFVFSKNILCGFLIFGCGLFF